MKRLRELIKKLNKEAILDTIVLFLVGMVIGILLTRSAIFLIKWGEEKIKEDRMNTKAYNEIVADLLELQNDITNLEQTIQNQKEQIDSMREQIHFLEEKNQRLIKQFIFESALEVPASEPPTYQVLNKYLGVVYFDGHKETYYNLPMDLVVYNALNKIDGLSGRYYWIRDDGCKMLGDYIMVAADYDIHPYGSIVTTSLGEGIVVDTGEFAKTNHEQIDIATNW